jgi:hypothetical protein
MTEPDTPGHLMIVKLMPKHTTAATTASMPTSSERDALVLAVTRCG